MPSLDPVVNLFEDPGDTAAGMLGDQVSEVDASIVNTDPFRPGVADQRPRGNPHRLADEIEQGVIGTAERPGRTDAGGPEIRERLPDDLARDLLGDPADADPFEPLVGFQPQAVLRGPVAVVSQMRVLADELRSRTVVDEPDHLRDGDLRQVLGLGGPRCRGTTGPRSSDTQRQRREGGRSQEMAAMHVRPPGGLDRRGDGGSISREF